MGQQQLLLIILGVIVVGIAVAVGITMFTDNAQSANRDAVSNDLVNFASRAQQYYRRPVELGGGGNSFTNLAITHITSKTTNSNGTYALSNVSAQGPVRLTGTGTEKGRDGQTVLSIVMDVWPDSARVVAGTGN